MTQKGLAIVAEYIINSFKKNSKPIHPHIEEIIGSPINLSHDTNEKLLDAYLDLKEELIREGY